MNTPVSFELAKLLNSKGLPGLKSFYSNKKHYNLNPIKYTIGGVVMWLYEKHGIWISVKKDYHNGALLGLESVIDNEDGFIDCGTFDSPTEAYEAAIKYVLENLI